VQTLFSNISCDRGGQCFILASNSEQPLQGRKHNLKEESS